MASADLKPEPPARPNRSPCRPCVPRVPRVIRPFEPGDVEAAAGLLVRRHAAHLVACPLLAPLARGQAVAALRAALATEGRSGWVAVTGGDVVGYLIGVPADARHFPDGVWVGDAGLAGERLEELYAVAAREWVAAGLRGHYVLVPPALRDTFFSLGFGQQQVHAARPAVDLPLDPRVRRAERRDIAALAALDLVLDDTLAASPVFSRITPVTLEQAREEWVDGIGDPAFTTFVAEADGRVLGAAIGVDVTSSRMNAGLLRPQQAGHLAFAAVLPEARGLGLGRALGQAVIGWAAVAGYPTVCTDWRSPNLGAARTWPRLGFRPTFLRLHRYVA